MPTEISLEQAKIIDEQHKTRLSTGPNMWREAFQLAFVYFIIFFVHQFYILQTFQ